MDSHSQTSTKPLIERASQGDQIALSVLLSLAHARLRQHLARRVPRDIQACVDVDDLMQEAQIQVFRSIASFRDTGPESFYRWVATIALHRLRNTVKALRAAKRGRLRTLTAGDVRDSASSFLFLLDGVCGSGNSPSGDAAWLEARKALQAAVDELPEHYGQAVRLVYLEGRSAAEAARIMGRTERAIHNLCYKAKELLHHSLGSTSRFFSKP